ncbi:MAG TPA: hypothetical protein VF532_03900 [Candidatus Angelobacter sp.]
MKHLIAILAVTLLSSALAAQTQHFKFTNDGAFAAVSGSTDLSSFNLQVSRTVANSGSSTTLTFVSVTFAPDFSSATLVEIVGTIPNNAFSGDNTKNLVLSLDSSTLDPTTSFSESCSLDFSQVDPVFTCGALQPGTIQLSFTENDVQRQRLIALEQFSTIGPVTFHVHQRADSGSASVQGSILGTTISSASATAGINHMSTFEFIR